MMYNPEKHHRRSIRLHGYDFTQAGCYFVTLCVQGHVCLFGHIFDGQMEVNASGSMILAAWDKLPDLHQRVEIDAFVVMPNHVHAVIVLAPPDGGQALSLADIVRRFKTFTTRRYIVGVRRYGWPPFTGRLWQRNYFEHIIRNERSLDRVRQYIADNPAKWSDDPENPGPRPS